MMAAASKPVPAAADSARPDAARRRRVSARGAFGAGVLILVVLIAVFADLVASHDPLATTISERLLPPGSAAREGGTYWLGTDPLGRDLLSRIVHGARASLLVGAVSVVLSGAIGVSLGLLAGYYGGPVDLVVMRIVDLQMAFPFIVLTIAVVAILGSSLVNVIVVLALASWVVYARLTRGLALSIRVKEYVEGARAIGCRDARIMLRYVLPNAMPAVIVVATYQFAHMIIAESALSFLGLGLPPPSPSWGASINDGRAYLDQAWWITTMPGLALMFTVMGATLLGDWARENFDPTLRVG